MSDQGGIDFKNDVNGREEMVSIRCLGRAIYGRFWRQGEPIRNGLFTDTSKPPESVFCANFLENPGTLSLLGGPCTLPNLELI